MSSRALSADTDSSVCAQAAPNAACAYSVQRRAAGGWRITGWPAVALRAAAVGPVGGGASLYRASRWGQSERGPTSDVRPAEASPPALTSAATPPRAESRIESRTESRAEPGRAEPKTESRAESRDSRLGPREPRGSIREPRVESSRVENREPSREPNDENREPTTGRRLPGAEGCFCLRVVKQ